MGRGSDVGRETGLVYSDGSRNAGSSRRGLEFFTNGILGMSTQVSLCSSLYGLQFENPTVSAAREGTDPKRKGRINRKNFTPNGSHTSATPVGTPGAVNNANSYPHIAYDPRFPPASGGAVGPPGAENNAGYYLHNMYNPRFSPASREGVVPGNIHPSWNNGDTSHANPGSNLPFQPPPPPRPKISPVKPPFPSGNGFRPSSHPFRTPVRPPPKSDLPGVSQGPPYTSKFNPSGYPTNNRGPPNVLPQNGETIHPLAAIDNPMQPIYPETLEKRPPYGPEYAAPTSTNDSNYHNPAQPKTSEYIQGQIGVILLALDTLKNEKIMPTKANITDFVRCSQANIRNANVKLGLKSAINQKMIVEQKIGSVQLYIGKNEKLWNCVNPLGDDAKVYPKAIWTQMKNFLTATPGRPAILASQSRYEAATILKQMCLKEYALGEVLQILNMIIMVKKWIIQHESGWQPLKIMLVEAISSATVSDGDDGWN